MTSSTRTLPEIGTKFHWLLDGLTFSRDRSKPLSGVQSHRGLTETVTPEFIAATTGTDGASWLSLIEDEDGQIDKWGRAFMKPGVAPQALVEHPWPRGSVEEANERSRRVAEAFQLPTQRQRDEALTAINREFPRSTRPTSSLRYRHYDEASE